VFRIRIRPDPKLFGLKDPDSPLFHTKLINIKYAFTVPYMYYQVGTLVSYLLNARKVVGYFRMPEYGI
jgi:hypothetical protein